MGVDEGVVSDVPAPLDAVLDVVTPLPLLATAPPVPGVVAPAVSGPDALVASEEPPAPFPHPYAAATSKVLNTDGRR